MPDRWRSFFIYLLRSLLKKLDDSDWEPEVHEIEQYMYRYLKCEDCMSAGECIHSDCKCKQPARAHVRTDFCPDKRYGPFLTKKGWANFKERKGLIFSFKEKLGKV